MLSGLSVGRMTGVIKQFLYSVNGLWPAVRQAPGFVRMSHVAEPRYQIRNTLKRRRQILVKYSHWSPQNEPMLPTV